VLVVDHDVSVPFMGCYSLRVLLVSYFVRERNPSNRACLRIGSNFRNLSSDGVSIDLRCVRNPVWNIIFFSFNAALLNPLSISLWMRASEIASLDILVPVDPQPLDARSECGWFDLQGLRCPLVTEKPAITLFQRSDDVVDLPLAKFFFSLNGCCLRGRWLYAVSVLMVYAEIEV
jgi:hypothetical protein